MNQENIVLVKNYLKAIKKELYAFPFLEPVDYIGLGLMDYPIFIKHPMDLGTVEKKLEEGKYNTMEELRKDLQLIWNNCKTYNKEGCDIYKAAQSCEKFTKRYFDKFMIGNTNIGSQSKSNKKTSKVNAAKTVNNSAKTTTNIKLENTSEVQNDLSSENKIPTEVRPFNAESIPSQNNFKAPNPLMEEPEIEDEPINPDGLNSNERIILSNRVKKLQNDGLASLVRLVQKECPNAIKETEDNIEIMLLSLDKKTHEQINRLIDTFLKVKETNQENLELKKNDIKFIK